MSGERRREGLTESTGEGGGVGTGVVTFSEAGFGVFDDFVAGVAGRSKRSERQEIVRRR